MSSAPVVDATGAGTHVLLVRAPSGRKLSKDYVAFNRLVERIGELERTIDTERDKLEFLLEWYLERLAPLERVVADEQLALARALAAAAEHCGLRGAVKKRLRAMVTMLCDEAFCRIKPDAETEAFYDAWSDISYRENLEQQLADLNDRVFGDDSFGPDDDEAGKCDNEDGDNEDTAAEADGAAERKDRGDSEEGRYDDATRGGRASRPDQREARLQRKVLAARKSVRDVYLSLAKVLHPDTVVDPAERTRRQDFMKQASSAYRAGDLAALLRLELTWIRRDESRLESLSAATLRTYIPSLREQVARLEDTLAALVTDPRYAPIETAACFPIASAKVQIQHFVRDTKTTIRHIRSLVLSVKACRDTAALTAFLRRMR